MNKNAFSQLTLNYSTLKELIEESCKLYASFDFFGVECNISSDKRKTVRGKKVASSSEFHWRKFEDVYNDALILKSAIEGNRALFGNSNEIMIVVYANKSYQMLITLLASMIVSNSNVTLLPIYDMIHIDALSKVLDQVTPCAVYVDTNGLSNLNQLSASKDRLSYMKTIILYDDHIKEGVEFSSRRNDITLLKYSELLQLNNRNDTNLARQKLAEPLFELLALTSINYRLCRIKSHQLLITMNDLLTFPCFHYNKHDIYYQINPYADVTEVVFLLILMQSGSRIAFCNNLSSFYSSVETLQPTLLNIYPMIWKTIYMTLQKIILSLSEEQQSIVTKAFKSKMKQNPRKSSKEDNSQIDTELTDDSLSKSKITVWDKLVFDKIKVKFGSKLRWLFTSNDILNSSISQFIELSLKAKLVQIYGTTETCGFISLKTDCSSFHMGDILPSKQVTMAKCPSIGYYSFVSQMKDSHSKYIEELCGEIVVMGEGRYEGYFNEDSSIKDEAISTGDYGVIVRKKSSFDSLEDKGSYSKLVFIERISDFLLNSHKAQCISPLMIESSFHETFNGRVSNIFISKTEESEQLSIVCQLSNLAICENPETMKQELRNEVEDYLGSLSISKDLYSNKNEKDHILKNIFFIEKCERLFSAKYKMRRDLLMKEIISQPK